MLNRCFDIFNQKKRLSEKVRLAFSSCTSTLKKKIKNRLLGPFGFYRKPSQCEGFGRYCTIWVYIGQRDLGSCRLLHLILWGSTKKGHWSFLHHPSNYRNAEKRQKSLGSIVWMVRRNNQCELLSLEIWFRRLSLKLGRSQDVGSVRYLLHFNAEALETV